MNDEPDHIRSNLSHHSHGEKNFKVQTDTVEVDSASASDMQPATNRSSEDLVVQRAAPLSRRPSSLEQDSELELGTQNPPQSPPRVEVLVEQSYHSSRSPIEAAHSASWAEERQGWSGAWPLPGCGNRTTIEARNGS
jgi:hypothetical protein